MSQQLSQQLGQQRRRWLRLQRRFHVLFWSFLFAISFFLPSGIDFVTDAQATPSTRPVDQVSSGQLFSLPLSAMDAGVIATPVSLAQSETPRWQQDLIDGLLAYNDGQFADAITHWHTALTQASSTPDSELTQAYLLSNVATAYQRLGQAEPAQTALAQGLKIIQSWPEQDQTYWEVSARVLNTQGQAQWEQGQTELALETWKEAEQHYVHSQPAGTNAGLVLTRINQALALQELGFTVQSVQQLSQISQQLTTPSPDNQLGVAVALGKALRRVGEFEKAQSVLSTSLASAIATDAPAQLELERQQIELELGHTARSLSARAIAVGQKAEATTYAEQALAHYNSVAQQTTLAQTSSIMLLQTQAQLNQLSTLIEIGQIATAQVVWPSIDLEALPTGRAGVEATISYAHSLGCLQAPVSTGCVTQEWQAELSASRLSGVEGSSRRATQQAMLAALTTAIRQAQALQDSLMESYAVGELGHSYELREQWSEAIHLTMQAVGLLEGRQLPDVAYRWEWQLGRIYRQQSALLIAAGKSVDSSAAQSKIFYQQALSSLAKVRQNLLLVNPQVQFSFRDNVEPIYREFVSLLLNEDAVGDDSTHAPIDQQSLKLAVKTLDALQLTELENFLGCNLSRLVNLNEAGIDPKAIKIYPIILPNKLSIIFDIYEKPLAVTTISVTQSQIESTLKSLRHNLTQPGKTPAVLKDAHQLYQWLISPLEETLSENGQIETMVFVPDGLLRNIPWGVLYDGEQYLIEKQYALAVAPQLDLFAPRWTPQQLKIVRGGIGLPQTVKGQQFPAIELLQAELEQIPETLTVASPLLDKSFTPENIEQQLSTEEYSAIHWKTHGVFSSDPSKTFLVAYEDGITANDLNGLIQSARARQAEPLELLVLSACATAQGDRRAVLGLAGIALRAGTRSTLSTLWRADDGANTQLMATFYQGIETGMSKAQSLQKAQQTLLLEAGYPAPYYWAPYVLVGNWL